MCETVNNMSSLMSAFCFSGKIKIQDILACSFLDDLLEVQLFHHSHFMSTFEADCWPISIGIYVICYKLY